MNSYKIVVLIIVREGSEKLQQIFIGLTSYKKYKSTQTGIFPGTAFFVCLVVTYKPRIRSKISKMEETRNKK